MQSMTCKHWLSLVILLLLTACGGGGSSSKSTPGTYTRDQIDVFIARSGLTVFPARYDVKIIKIVYRTVDAVGNPIDASGLLAVPQKAAGLPSPILSLQHGTIFLDSDAPSNSFNEKATAAIVGSQGFIVAMPDYIGYGASGDQIHPYLHAATLASATIDLIRAVRSYLADNAILENGQLFLAGYSEGGYATLATHKVMQEELGSEFTVTASVPAEGPYDMSQTANTVLSTATLAYAPYVAFLFKAYDTVYVWNRIDEFFQAPYVDAVNTSFDGTKDGDTIAASLTNDRDSLINATFLTDFLNSGELDVKAALAENDIYDWAPDVPVRLFHGMGDMKVPYANATTAATTMTNPSNNAPDVMVIDCDAGALPANHDNCYLPFADYALTFLMGQATDL